MFKKNDIVRLERNGKYEFREGKFPDWTPDYKYIYLSIGTTLVVMNHLPSSEKHLECLILYDKQNDITVQMGLGAIKMFLTKIKIDCSKLWKEINV